MLFVPLPSREPQNKPLSCDQALPSKPFNLNSIGPKWLLDIIMQKQGINFQSSLNMLLFSPLFDVYMFCFLKSFVLSE